MGEEGRRGLYEPGRGAAVSGRVAPADVERAFRAESGRAVAILVRSFRDIDLAEESVQEAFVRALSRWPRDGLPPNVAGWIVTCARRCAIDVVRREQQRGDKHAIAGGALYDNEDGPEMEDDLLRLIFTCAHPALAPESRVALTLRLVAGLQTPEIARAFLVPEATMAQRLVRAKRKIRLAKIPFRVPALEELPERIDAVLAVLYLVFNEGHVATTGSSLVRAALCEEAIRLARLLHAALPRSREVHGLLALFLLTHARAPARVGPRGVQVRLADQDRGRWNRALVDEGQAIVRACVAANEPGPYQLQAAIAAVHSAARGAADTAWDDIVELYDQLLVFGDNPVARLNRAVALSERDGATAGLAELAGLDEVLASYAPYHATRAALLARCERVEEARAAYTAAIETTDNAVQAAWLTKQRDDL